MKAKNKMLIVGIASLVILTSVTAFQKDQSSLSFDLKSSPSVVKEFNQEQNKSLKKSVFKSENVEEKDSRLKLDLSITPEKENPEVLKVSGKGQFKVEKDSYQFNVNTTTSRLNKVNLTNGYTYIYGPIDTVIKKTNGQEINITLGMNYVPELNKSLVNVTGGTLEGENFNIPFGQFDVSEEVGKYIQEYMESRAGGTR
ncbi:hypothetical protein [Paenibacillus chitinolyticus]|uniref:hypothetical protein n=1 Tax=Paenibacillus chitinolyticus TaxID=79263 RepID=UPI003D06F2AD